MRILLVAPYPPRRCGIGAYARDQAARLRVGGHAVTVLSPPDGDGEVTAAFLGGAAFLRAARIGGPFDRILVHFQPALYYRPRRPVSKVLTSGALLILAAWRGRKLEVLVHEADPPLLWRPDYVLLREAFRRCGMLSFHTGQEREALGRGYHLRVRGRLVPHRMEPAERPTKAEARGELGIPAHGGPVFVCAGFLHPSKGYDRAVEAFAAATRPNGETPPGAAQTGHGGGPAQRPEASASLYIVGSIREQTPENEAYLAALRRRAGQVGGVTVVNSYVDDRDFDRWLAAADWVVLPYRRSWSSGVLARAHAHGTPAIVSGVGGLIEQAGSQDVVIQDDEGLRRAMRHAVMEGGKHG
jgi:glycosyltransferase involved in cell wall biosynthesis